MPDQADITAERIDIAIGQRVRIVRTIDPRFHGMEGRVIERDRRLPFSRVELDRQPIDCSSRTFWFGNDQMEWL